MKELTSANIKESLQSVTGFYALIFHSPTCGPCQTMKPVYEKLEELSRILTCFKIDTSMEMEIAEHYEIRGVPSILFCKEANVLFRQSGITPLYELEHILKELQSEHFKLSGTIHPIEKEKSHFVFYAIGVIVLAYFLIAQFL